MSIVVILFINDMPLHTKGDVYMYADHSTLSAVGKSVKELEDQLNLDLEQIDNWCVNNRVLVNTLKTNVMLMQTWQKRYKLTEMKEFVVYLKG